MRRVLIVDDREENVYFMSALLSAHGWDVTSARHGAEALGMAREHVPDLVVADLLMPVMDGFTLLRNWKLDPLLRDTPFVIYTATYTAPEDEELARKLGADDFILKPVEPEILFARLSAVRTGATRGAPTAPEPISEGEVLREYSQTLVRKLEQKTLQLEETNRCLQRDIAARERAETALRASEAELRHVVESIPQLVWICRPDGTCAFFNRQWVDYTGRSSEESEREGWLERVHPDERASVRDAWRKSVGASETFSAEARLRRKDGLYRFWLVRSVPFQDEGGGVLRWFGTCTDIDDMKRAASRLQEAEERLRQSQKLEAIGQLAAGIAHDFNNLLSVILSYSSFIIDEAPHDSSLRADMEQVRAAGERAAALTEGLLTFGRKTAATPRPTDLGEVVAPLEKMVRRLLRDDVQLDINVDGALGRVLLAPSSIEQIVMNLVVNARDAMPAGGRIVLDLANVTLEASDIATHEGVSAGRYVKLEVTDTGFGMDAATRGRIFEPFFTTKAAGKGTGLGLATVYGIVKQSGGHIVVASERGVGTTLQVYLPRCDEASERKETDTPAPAALRGTETVLLVERADEVRTLVRSILRRGGYQVIDVTNPGEALLASEQHEGAIHLLLTDVIMSRMNGRELAARVSGRRPEVRLLFTSGYSEEAVLHHGVLDAGAAFLPKPFTPNAVLAKVRAVLDGAPLPQADRTRDTARPRSRARANEHVLLIDDERSLLDLTARILKRLGYRVTAFTDPIEALRAFDAEPSAFDAVVADVIMPGASGFDVARAVRRRRPQVAVVMTSEYARPEDVREAEALGLRSLLVKPDSVEELGLVLHDELRRRGASSPASGAT